jgi:hypothetical protein
VQPRFAPRLYPYYHPARAELTCIPLPGRLAELQQEVSAIQAAFPDRGGAPTGRKRGRPAKQVFADIDAPRGKRPGWSDEARKAVGERMKAYWVKKRGESKTEATREAGGSHVLVEVGATLLLFVAGAAWALVDPARGLQDRLAGTWLVPH